MNSINGLTTSTNRMIQSLRHLHFSTLFLSLFIDLTIFGIEVQHNINDDCATKPHHVNVHSLTKICCLRRRILRVNMSSQCTESIERKVREELLVCLSTQLTFFPNKK